MEIKTLQKVATSFLVETLLNVLFLVPYRKLVSKEWPNALAVITLQSWMLVSRL